MTYDEYYAQMRADAPDMDEELLWKNAATAALLDKQLEQRRKQLGGVRLVAAQEPSNFVTALLSNVDTTGKMRAVKPEESA